MATVKLENVNKTYDNGAYKEATLIQQRIGIFGGSFNPVHLGHLNIAHEALDRIGLTKVLFIPCKVSPFKTQNSPNSFVEDFHRIKMIKLSIQDCESFELSELEINRGGVSYSYDTVSGIREMCPDSELFFLIGSDTLQTLSQWHKIHALLNMCDFVTVGRPRVKEMSSVPGFSTEESRRLTEFRIPGKLLDISSSEIRRKIAAGESINGLVTSDVAEYIQTNNLYCN